MNTILKPLGWVLGMLAIAFGGTFILIGIIIAIPTFLIKDGFEFGMQRMQLFMRNPDMESPWSKVPAPTAGRAASST